MQIVIERNVHSMRNRWYCTVGQLRFVKDWGFELDESSADFGELKRLMTWLRRKLK